MKDKITYNFCAAIVNSEVLAFINIGEGELTGLETAVLVIDVHVANIHI